MNDRFKTVEEFYDNLRRGGEIEFKYNGKEYSITHPEGKIVVIEQYNYETEKIYDKVEKVGEYIIENRKLKDIITDLEIIFRSF